MVQALRHRTASAVKQEILRIMKIRAFAIIIAAIVLTSLAVKHAVKAPSSSATNAPVAMHSTLPSQTIAKMLLNSTHRHREWVNVPVGSAGVRAFIVYPERSDNAPIVMVTANKQGASDWIRGVRDSAFSVPAADKKTASVEFDAGDSRIQAAVENPVAGARSATFNLTAEDWPQAVAFLTR